MASTRERRHVRVARHASRSTRRVEIGEDTMIGPARRCAARPRSAPAARSGPPPRSSTRRSATSVDRAARLPRRARGSATARASARSPTCAPARDIGEGAKIGTFVEVKNSDIGAGREGAAPLLHRRRRHRRGAPTSRAGNITANYDGATSPARRSANGVKTGVDTSFVAPVTSATGRTLAAGSVITRGRPRRRARRWPGPSRRTSRDTPSA